jgi:hypothetical protein
VDRRIDKHTREADAAAGWEARTDAGGGRARTHDDGDRDGRGGVLHAAGKEENGGREIDRGVGVAEVQATIGKKLDLCGHHGARVLHKGHVLVAHDA